LRVLAQRKLSSDVMDVVPLPPVRLAASRL
jgi:hypothetical protein